MNSNTLTLDKWYSQPFGQSILQRECEELNPFLAKIPALLMLQLGCTEHINKLVTSPIVRRITFCKKIELIHPKHLAQSSYRQLPLVSESVDIIVLPHILDTELQAEEILREACRIIAPDGHIAIFGFNPWSLWSLSRLLKADDRFPEQMSFHSVQKINAWLLSFEAEIVTTSSFSFKAPKNLSSPFNPSLEKLGKQLLPHAGGIYFILAKKRVIPMSPIKARWTLEPVLEQKHFAQPTAGRLRRE